MRPNFIIHTSSDCEICDGRHRRDSISTAYAKSVRLSFIESNELDNLSFIFGGQKFDMHDTEIGVRYIFKCEDRRRRTKKIYVKVS